MCVCVCMCPYVSECIPALPHDCDVPSERAEAYLRERRLEPKDGQGFLLGEGREAGGKGGGGTTRDHSNEKSNLARSQEQWQ